MIGQLDKRITFKRPVRTEDGRGSWTEVPAVVATVWGAVHPLRGAERVRYQAAGSEADTRIIIRPRDDIDATCWAYWGDREYEIEDVRNPAEAGEYMILLVVERRPAG